MAYNMKDVFYLDTSIDTTTSAGDGIATLDLSSYVDPIARGKSKGQGLAIYKVFFDVTTVAGNDAPPAADNGQLRAGLASLAATPAFAVGAASISDNMLNASNDLMIAGINYYGGGTAAGDPAPHVFLEPSAEVPYIVVRDQIVLAVSITTAMGSASAVKVRMECGIVTLDQSTLNQLLRTQTV
jgi:hypothetical protein